MASSVGGQRNIWVRNCRFADFMPGSATTTYAAIYTWPSDGVHIYDNELSGCGRAITIDQPDGVARVIGNRITSADATKMATGIYIRRSSGVAEGEVVVAENTVRGARLDPAGTGSEGHGIAVFRVMDVQITNNHCEGNARGILVSGLSFGATVQGNTCVGNNDAGIRCEPEIIAKDISVGVDAKRGITVVGNVVRDNLSLGTPGGTNSGLGITMSYAAGLDRLGQHRLRQQRRRHPHRLQPGHDRRQRRLQQLEGLHDRPGQRQARRHPDLRRHRLHRRRQPVLRQPGHQDPALRPLPVVRRGHPHRARQPVLRERAPARCSVPTRSSTASSGSTRSPGARTRAPRPPSTPRRCSTT